MFAMGGLGDFLTYQCQFLGGRYNFSFLLDAESEHKDITASLMSNEKPLTILRKILIPVRIS